MHITLTHTTSLAAVVLALSKVAQLSAETLALTDDFLKCLLTIINVLPYQPIPVGISASD